MDSTYEYSNWVLIGVVIYLAAMLYIGYLASKRIESNTDFLVAGRRLGVFFCSGTLFATWFGSGTCMGGAGNAYLFGNQGVLFDPWGAAVCLMIAGFFFARIMRRGRFMTLADIFDIRYGRGMGMLSTATISVAEIGWVGAQL
ncbi:MAG: sodium:solute symporter, partial [Deltaproteobacteria bacterium CG_4_9_14_3_um_filter_63_12]